jgi:hypothetical protein
MADLKTESEYVRQSLADHLNDILSLGAAGFRLDAAKHIPTADLQSIWSRLSRTPYTVQEVINQTPAPPASYVQFGTVTITKSYAALEAAFLGTAGPASLNGWENGRERCPPSGAGPRTNTDVLQRTSRPTRPRSSSRRTTASAATSAAR